MGALKEYYHDEINRNAEDYEYQYEQYQRQQQERDKVIEENMPLATHIAKQYGGMGIPDEDLRQLAYEGLVLAASEENLNDPHFIGIATNRIKNNIRNALSKNSRLYSLPSYYTTSLKQITNLEDNMFKKQGYVDLEEILRIMGIKRKTFLSIVGLSNAYTEEVDENTKGSDYEEDEGLLEDVLKALQDELNDREYSIFILRRVYDMSPEEVCNRLSLSGALFKRKITIVNRKVEKIREKLKGGN